MDADFIAPVPAQRDGAGAALVVTCRARRHETPAARAAGCVCPTEFGRPYQPPPTDGDDLGDDLGDVAMLAAATRTLQAALEEVMRRADVWAQAFDGRPEYRARAVAMFAADLRDRVDGAPGGWAAMVAELAMRLTEQGDPQR